MFPLETGYTDAKCSQVQSGGHKNGSRLGAVFRRVLTLDRTNATLWFLCGSNLKGFNMSTPIRIKDDVYSRLEINAKGYESVSDTIKRSIYALEVLEAVEMVCRQVDSSIDILKNENLEKEKTLLVHYSEDAIVKAMDVVVKIYANYTITYQSDVNFIKILVSRP